MEARGSGAAGGKHIRARRVCSRYARMIGLYLYSIGLYLYLYTIYNLYYRCREAKQSPRRAFLFVIYGYIYIMLYIK